MRARDVLTLTMALAGCADVGAARGPVVYETDDRMEVYEHPSAVHRAIAQSAVAMQMSADWLDTSDPPDVRITYEGTLGEAHSLCEDVRYAEQIEPGTCSGTLIDSRHILTAGHCVATAEDCDGASWPWVFGFYYESAGALRTPGADDVYYCERTVVFSNEWGADYAVIELDRPVVGHTPAPIGGPAPIGTPVTLIGHPNGIPMKIAGNATVRGAEGIELFADVDAFFGNSGSGVFDDAGEVVGILVAGAPRDYENRPGGCREVVVIDPVPDGEGETLTAVETPIELFCATGVSSPVCGGADAGVPGADAGALDGGVDAGAVAPDASAPDAATSAPDAAASGSDAAANAPDAALRPDAGSGAAVGGCGCRAAGGDRRGAALVMATIAWIVLRRRRRRKVDAWAVLS